MIVGYVRSAQLEWREPGDEEVVEQHPAPSPAPSPGADPPPAAAAQERAGAPLPRNLLDTLPPAGVQPPPSAPPSTAAAANSTPVSSYVGERPVDPTWLAARETALVAVRADYEAARARAQANGGTGPGWTPAVLVTDESGQTHSASGAPLLHVTDPNAAPVQVGWDEGGPVYQPDPGTWLEFDEAAFAAAYRAQGGAPLQALAAQYGTNAATLLAQHPDLWAVATTDHALNAGPAPAGVAMGNASQLGMLDLYLADPQIASLVQTYGGTVAPATGGIAQEQVRLYGHARYEQLSRLGNAMQSVRDQYAAALTQGFISGAGPGWVEREVTTYVTDESGQQIASTSTERGFDPDAFTAWYIKQDGQANQAFFDFYGASHTSFTTDELGHRVPGTVRFDNPNWNLSEVSGVGYPMTHGELVSIDPNSPPDLNNDQAVGFDLEAGWATSQVNLHQDTDWFETVVKVAIVAVVAYASAGTLGPAVAGSMGMSTAAAGTAVTAASLTTGGVIVSAAVAGAATSVASGIVNDNLTFKGVLQGALAGALTGGLTGVGSTLGDAARGFGPVGTIALNTTVQGGIQALLGGSFKDGAIAGFASGLASLAGAGIGKGIDDAVKAGSMNAAEAMAARSLARVFTSAVQALGNPNDPSYGFASALVNGVVGQAVEPAAPSDQSAAETARLGQYQNAASATADAQYAQQSDAILARRGAELAATQPLTDDEPMDNAPLPRTADGGLILPSGRIVHPSVTVGPLQPTGPGYMNAQGMWVPDGNQGIAPIGDVVPSRYALTDLPAQYQSANGPVRAAWDDVGQGFLAVPRADGGVDIKSSPDGYQVPSRASFDAAAIGQGLADTAASTPSAVADLAKASWDGWQMLGSYATGRDGHINASSSLVRGIESGRVTWNGMGEGLVQNSPVGFLINAADGDYYQAGGSLTGTAVGLVSGPLVSRGVAALNELPVLGTDVGQLIKSGSVSHEVVDISKMPDGLAYRTDLPEHLVGPDGFTNTGRLSGTHNLDNAVASLDSKGATYTLTPTSTSGVLELQYKYVDSTTGKTVSGSKTVYDPVAISDQAMLEYSLKAGEAAWNQYLADPTKMAFDVSIGGVNFRAYINFDKYGNPYVGNVHPIK